MTHFSKIRAAPPLCLVHPKRVNDLQCLRNREVNLNFWMCQESHLTPEKHITRIMSGENGIQKSDIY